MTPNKFPEPHIPPPQVPKQCVASRLKLNIHGGRRGLSVITLWCSSVPVSGYRRSGVEGTKLGSSGVAGDSNFPQVPSGIFTSGTAASGTTLSSLLGPPLFEPLDWGEETL